ncbi:MAG: NfeD family protein [Porphyromonas sp.]|nr:NfeD family protein [Porphyromonas sp.]
MILSATTIFILVLFALLAVALALAELFFIPGWGIAGTLSLALLIWMLYFAYTLSPIVALCLLFFCLLLFAIGAYWISKSKALDKIQLSSKIEGKTPNEAQSLTIGMRGKTTSRLALSGNIILEGSEKIVEATSLEGLIDENETVEIVRLESGKILVRKVHH